jgi:hypothetical protein
VAIRTKAKFLILSQSPYKREQETVDIAGLLSTGYN